MKRVISLPFRAGIVGSATGQLFDLRQNTELLPVPETSSSLSLFFFNLQNRHIDIYFIELLQEFSIGLHEIGIGFNEINSEVPSVELDI